MTRGNGSEPLDLVGMWRSHLDGDPVPRESERAEAEELRAMKRNPSGRMVILIWTREGETRWDSPAAQAVRPLSRVREGWCMSAWMRCEDELWCPCALDFEVDHP